MRAQRSIRRIGRFANLIVAMAVFLPVICTSKVYGPSNDEQCCGKDRPSRNQDRWAVLAGPPRVSVGLDAGDQIFGLTRANIKNRLVLRLGTQNARLNLAGADLQVDVRILGPKFKVDIRISPAMSPGTRGFYSEPSSLASSATRTHHNSATYILDSIDKQLDRLLGTYLRANQE